MRRDLAIIILTLIGLLVPFINKVPHCDDIIYLQVAKNILKNPLKPFNFPLKLYGNSLPDLWVLAHPPLTSYFLAFWMLLGKGNEWFIHLKFLIFPLAAAIFYYLLINKFNQMIGDSVPPMEADRFYNLQIPALLSTLLFMVAPAFSVSSSNLMADLPALSLFLAALYFFVKGSYDDLPFFQFLSGVFISLAMLCSYQTLLILPIVLLYIFIFRVEVVVLARILVFPLLTLALWSFYSLIASGQVHILRILLGYQGDTVSMTQKFLYNLTALGGTVIFPLMFIIHALTRRVRFYMLLLSLMGATILSLLFALDYPPWSFLLLIFLMGCGIYIFLIIIVHMLRNVEREAAKDITTIGDIVIFFGLWFLTAFVFTTIFQPFGAVRYLLLTLPAIPPLFLRILHRVAGRKGALLLGWLAIILSGTLSLFCLISDYHHANIYRQFAQQAIKYLPSLESENSRRFFIGGFGLGYELAKYGFSNFNYQLDALNKGDFIAYSTLPMLQVMRKEVEELLECVFHLKRSTEPITIWDPAAKAGFYTNSSGLLPYNFPSDQAETLFLCQVPFDRIFELASELPPDFKPQFDANLSLLPITLLKADFAFTEKDHLQSNDILTVEILWQLKQIMPGSPPLQVKLVNKFNQKRFFFPKEEGRGDPLIWVERGNIIRDRLKIVLPFNFPYGVYDLFLEIVEDKAHPEGLEMQRFEENYSLRLNLGSINIQPKVKKEIVKMREIIRFGVSPLAKNLSLDLSPGAICRVKVDPILKEKIVILSYMGNAEKINQGEKVAVVRLFSQGKKADEIYLKAGEDTAEWAIDREDVRSICRHQKAKVAYSWREKDKIGDIFKGYFYLSQHQLKSGWIDELELEYLSSIGRLNIESIYLY